MAWRSAALTVEVVRNKRGWYINESLAGVPVVSHGPLEGPITLAAALTFVATTMKLEGRDDHPPAETPTEKPDRANHDRRPQA